MTKKNMIIIVLSLAVIFTATGAILFREKRTRVEIKNQAVESIVHEMVREGDRTLLLSFEGTVSELEWRDESIVFEAQKRDDDYGRYIYHSEDGSLNLEESLEKPSEVEANTKRERLAYDKSLLWTLGSGLHILEGEHKQQISANVEFEGESSYVISDNKEKLAYFDSELQKLIIYNVKNGKSKAIDIFLDKSILSNMGETVVFSADAGYFFVYHMNDDINQSYFSILGADSGTVYGDKIRGAVPAWSPTELKVAYIYLEGAEILPGIAGGTILGQRIGLFNLKKRKPIYIGAIDNEGKVINRLNWASNGASLSYLSGVKKEDASGVDVSTIYNYDLGKRVFQNHNIGSWTINNEQSFKWELGGHYIVMEGIAEGKSVLKVQNTLDNSSYHEVNSRSYLCNGKSVSSFSFADQIVLVNDIGVLMTNGKSMTNLLVTEGEVTEVAFSDKGNKVVIVIQEEEALTLAVTEVELEKE